MNIISTYGCSINEIDIASGDRNENAIITTQENNLAAEISGENLNTASCEDSDLLNYSKFEKGYNDYEGTINGNHLFR